MLDKRAVSLREILGSARDFAAAANLIKFDEKLTALVPAASSDGAPITSRQREAAINDLESLISVFKSEISPITDPTLIADANILLERMEKDMPPIIAAWKHYDQQKEALVQVHQALWDCFYWGYTYDRTTPEALSVNSYFSYLMRKKTITFVDFSIIEKLSWRLYANASVVGSESREAIEQSLANLEVLILVSGGR